VNLVNSITQDVLYLRYSTSNSSAIWTSVRGLQLADSFSINENTAYGITISGTVDKHLAELKLSVDGSKTNQTGFSSYSLGTITPDEANIPIGAFEKTFTLTTTSSFQNEPYDFRGVTIRNYATTGGNITEGSYATISNFSITITEMSS